MDEAHYRTARAGNGDDAATAGRSLTQDPRHQPDLVVQRHGVKVSRGQRAVTLLQRGDVAYVRQFDDLTLQEKNNDFT